MENKLDLMQYVDSTADNLKNLLKHLISEIVRLEKENEELKQRLGE